VLRRIVLLLIVLPVSIGVVALAVANRHAVSLVLDPFAGNLAVQLPLFVLLFAALILGVVLGGAAVWFRQGRYRRAARAAGRDARRASAEAEQLRAEHQRIMTAASGRPALAAPPSLPDRRSAA